MITVIEILSPTNKRPGKERDDYLNKRLEILASFTHLVEVDLLRGWQPLPVVAEEDIRSDYSILVSQSERSTATEIYTFNLPETIPIFFLLLRLEDNQVLVDLQALLADLYDRARYDLTIDYGREPVPHFSERDGIWANTLLHQQKLR